METEARLHFINLLFFFYPQPMEARVAVEELHLLRRKWSQNFLDGEELVDLALAREERLSIAQLSQDAAHRPHVHRLAVRSAGNTTQEVKLLSWYQQYQSVLV